MSKILILWYDRSINTSGISKVKVEIGFPNPETKAIQLFMTQYPFREIQTSLKDTQKNIQKIEKDFNIKID